MEIISPDCQGDRHCCVRAIMGMCPIKHRMRNRVAFRDVWSNTTSSFPSTLVTVRKAQYLPYCLGLNCTTPMFVLVSWLWLWASAKAEQGRQLAWLGRCHINLMLQLICLLALKAKGQQLMIEIYLYNLNWEIHSYTGADSAKYHRATVCTDI